MQIVCEITERFKRGIETADVASVQACLQDGFDPDMRKHGRLTPLMKAVRYPSLELVELLVSFDADINARAPGGTALIMALKRVHLVTAHREIIEYLLSLNPDLAIEDKNGRNALYYAIKYAHDEIVDKLIHAGAGLIIDSAGLSPLYYACKYRNTKLFRQL